MSNTEKGGWGAVENEVKGEEWERTFHTFFGAVEAGEKFFQFIQMLRVLLHVPVICATPRAQSQQGRE